jgi:uncharacterized membrane protein YebE (DUF533 family)
MKRLTIGVQACTEILALLITFAWADGKLLDEEKEGVRGAAQVLNLPKELRARLESLIEKPIPLDQVMLESLSTRDKAFAYVAAAWMMGLDENADPKEEALLKETAERLGFGEKHTKELDAIAEELRHVGKGKDKSCWADDIMSLFKAIPPRLEKLDETDVEVVFE